MKWQKLVLFLLLTMLFSGCDNSSTENKDKNGDEVMKEKVNIILNPQKKYQKIESFGASGAWWAQDIGGWVDKEDGLAKRDKIASLLFDKENGIGLSSYRYNLGAGSADSDNNPKITDKWRQAESFEISPGKYDWSKDGNAQYMLKKATNYGVNNIYLFANSPLERLTKSGSAYGKEIDGTYSNFAADNYTEFNNYLFDVTEHFLEQGIPIKYLSPMNEPQWEWIEGQEGAHFEPQEVVNFAKQIYREKKQRPALKDVSISLPELGEWGNTSQRYYEAMIEDTDFMDMYDTWDVHSYWSDEFQKKELMDYIENNDINVTLKMSEWTEMVNGKDITMDSALTLANTIYEDLTVLNVIDWQYWIAVSCYDYRDGLIYVDRDTHDIELTKRLWVFGNFSKFIRPGANRIDTVSSDKDVNVIGFIDETTEKTIVVAINNGLTDKIVSVPRNYNIENVYETSEASDLEKVTATKHDVVIPRLGIATIELSEK